MFYLYTRGYTRPSEISICISCYCHRASVIFPVKVLTQDASEFQACWKYHLKVMRGTDMFSQWPGYLGHEQLGNDWSHIDVYSGYGLL